MIKSICFTGHRPDKMFGYDLSNPQYQVLAKELRKALEIAINQHGADTFYSGCALGFDTIAYYVVENLKIKYPNIQNIICVPTENHSSNWFKDTDINRFKHMLQNADKVVRVYEIPKYRGYSIGQQLNKRNHYMVDNADCVFAYWNGTSGGTKNCIDYANSLNKLVHNIY